MTRVNRLGWLVVLIIAPVTVRAQAVSPVQTAQQRYKNIHVLKDIPADQMNVTMHLMQAQLGVNCQFCHVGEQFERDENAMKLVARRMLEMTDTANKSFGGNPVVTCYTCHRGQPKPTSTVVLPVANPRSPMAGSTNAPTMPSAQEILTRYVQSVGGERALRAVATRVVAGTRDMPTGPGGVSPVAAGFEISQKAPNLVVTLYKGEKIALGDGFDGSTAWQRNAAGVVTPVPAPEQGRLRRSAALLQPLTLASEYARLDVAGVESVGGKPAYVVVGYPADDEPERLFFDAESGLLVRKVTQLVTPIGAIPLQVDYSDYRATPGGVRIPFLVRSTPASLRSELSTSSTLRISEVREGIPLDDARFAKPR